MAVLENLVADPIPIQMDEEGTARVGGTRVRLDTVLTAFEQGSAAEEILLKYPALKLEDIYAVITYWLRHKAQVQAYLDERRQLAERVRQQNDERFPARGLRERLIARRSRGS